MGIDVSLRTRKWEQDCQCRLSRGFCNFLCGPDAYENSEFSQIEDLLEIDLELLRKIPDEPMFLEIDYKIYLAEEEKDWHKAEELRTTYQNIKDEWIHGIYGSDEKWTKIEDMRVLVKLFLTKITSNANYYSELNYNYDWGDYFLAKRKRGNTYKMYPKEWRESLKRLNNILSEDLKMILAYLDCVEAKGHKLVGFQYG